MKQALTVKEAAELLDVTTRHLYSCLKRGDFDGVAVKVGGRCGGKGCWRFSARKLHDIYGVQLEEHMQETQA